MPVLNERYIDALKKSAKKNSAREHNRKKPAHKVKLVKKTNLNEGKPQTSRILNAMYKVKPIHNAPFLGKPDLETMLKNGKGQEYDKILREFQAKTALSDLLNKQRQIPQNIKPLIAPISLTTKDQLNSVLLKLNDIDRLHKEIQKSSTNDTTTAKLRDELFTLLRIIKPEIQGQILTSVDIQDKTDLKKFIAMVKHAITTDPANTLTQSVSHSVVSHSPASPSKLIPDHSDITPTRTSGIAVGKQFQKYRDYTKLCDALATENINYIEFFKWISKRYEVYGYEMKPPELKDDGGRVFSLEDVAKHYLHDIGATPYVPVPTFASPAPPSAPLSLIQQQLEKDKLEREAMELLALEHAKKLKEKHDEERTTKLKEGFKKKGDARKAKEKQEQEEQDRQAKDEEIKKKEAEAEIKSQGPPQDEFLTPGSVKSTGSSRKTRMELLGKYYDTYANNSFKKVGILRTALATFCHQNGINVVEGTAKAGKRELFSIQFVLTKDHDKILNIGQMVQYYQSNDASPSTPSKLPPPKEASASAPAPPSAPASALVPPTPPPAPPAPPAHILTPAEELRLEELDKIIKHKKDNNENHGAELVEKYNIMFPNPSSQTPTGQGFHQHLLIMGMRHGLKELKKTAGKKIHNAVLKHLKNYYNL